MQQNGLRKGRRFQSGDIHDEAHTRPPLPPASGASQAHSGPAGFLSIAGQRVRQPSRLTGRKSLALAARHLDAEAAERESEGLVQLFFETLSLVWRYWPLRDSEQVSCLMIELEGRLSDSHLRQITDYFESVMEDRAVRAAKSVRRA